MINHTTPTFEYDYIDDGIYVGTNVCCQTHYDERLLDENITAEISLEGEQIDQPYGVETFMWLPTQDHTSATVEQLAQGVAHLEQLVSHNKKVYVHCRMGHGRGPSLAIAYFAKTREVSTQEAFDFVKSKRDVIHLNSEQIEGITRYLQTHNA